MTINIFKAQRMLQLLGQDIQADGYWGPISEAALDAEIQKREPEDDGDFWKHIRYFTRAEFRCTCGKYCNGYPVEPTEALVRGCDALRERAGVPLFIIQKGGSGIRCPQHNRDVHGASNSYHLYGMAADLHPSGAMTPADLYALADAMLGKTGELGLYSWGIHYAPEGNYSRFKG